MKTTLTLIFACMVALYSTAHGEERYHLDWIPNAYLPADAVEPSSAHEVQPGEFYAKQPTEHPLAAPATFVLVWVYQETVTGVRFVGWQWMDADFVNALHGTVTVSL